MNQQLPPPPEPTTEARIEAARRVLVADPVPWDELRERRVLGSIEARLDGATMPNATQGSTASAGTRRGAVVAVIGAAVAVAAAVVAVLWLGPVWSGSDATDASGRGIAVAETPAADPGRPAIPFARPPTMALADGSVAELHDGARLEVQQQTAEVVRLDQRSGTVRYEVAKNPARSFVVDAHGVEVRVIGTVFTVAYAGDAHVEVSVERGLVQVASADSIARLGAGDSLRVEVVAEPDDFLIIEDDDSPAVVGMARRRGKARRAKPEPPTDAPVADEGPSLDALLAESDAARAAGDLPRAATALRQLVTRFPKNSQSVSAYFQLGNVERRRARHTAAASAFAACVRRSPRGTLAEDARAESAQSWADAGRNDKAKAGAQAYLERYPAGAHAARMQRIVDRSE